MRWPGVDADWIADQAAAVRWALVVLAALLVLGMGAVWRLPEHWRVQQEQDAAAQVLAEGEQARQSEMYELDEVRAALAAAQGRLQAARWRLSAGEGLAALMERLTWSAHVHGLLVEQLDLLDEVRHEGYWQTPLQLQVTGHYGALRLWLDDWLGQVRLLGTGDFQWSRVEPAGERLRLNLQVHAYRADGLSPMPASLADEPARPAPGAPAVDLFAKAVIPGEAGLAGVPLGQLQMVGSLFRGEDRQVLLSVGGQVHRVRLGDVLGRNEGRVVGIDETSLEVRERLFTSGRWQEHSVFLRLGQGRQRGGTDEAGYRLEMAVGAGVADSAGSSDALPR